MKTYSLRRRIFHIYFVLITMLFLFTILYSTFTMISIQRNTMREIHQIQTLYNSQMTVNLKSVNNFLTQEANYNMDISLVSAQSDLSNYYDNLLHIFNTFETNLSSFPNINGFFIYFKNCDYFLVNMKNSGNDYLFTRNLSASFSDGSILDLISISTINKWLPYEYSGKYYLIDLFKINDCYIGAWTDTDTLSLALDQLGNTGGITFYVDEDGIPVSSQLHTTSAHFKIPLKNTKNTAKIIKYDGQKYAALSTDLDFCNYYLTTIIPLSILYSSLYKGFYLFICLLILSISLAVFLYKQLTRYIAEPLYLLDKTAAKISNGEIDTRINISTINCQEIINVSNSLNNMIDVIQNLKIDVYEESLLNKDLEMQNLRSQIAPHFLVNCLNLISFLADGTQEHSAILQSLISSLSIHLRYILNVEKTVPLSEEIKLCKNYLHLSAIRFPDCLSYAINVNETLNNAEVFPLFLLMFTENSIKHNLIMGEKLDVSIHIEMENRDGNPFLHVIHTDNGHGFPTDILQKYNGTNPIPSADAKHVGLYNIIKRLQLTYGDSAYIHLSNETDAGARIDIVIPYIKYECDKKP